MKYYSSNELYKSIIKYVKSMTLDYINPLKNSFAEFNSVIFLTKDSSVNLNRGVKKE